MSALDALAAASAAGVRLILDGGDIIAEAPKLPPDVVDSLRAVKLDLTRILVCRESREGRVLRRRSSRLLRRALDNGAERPAPVPRRRLGRPGGADGLDQGRAVPRAGALAAGRSCRRGTPHRRLPSGRGDGRVDRDHDEFGVWAKISSDRKGACGMTLLLFNLFDLLAVFRRGRPGEEFPRWTTSQIAVHAATRSCRRTVNRGYIDRAECRATTTRADSGYFSSRQ